jgi:disulfide bond formation protein DsbB
VNRQTPRSSLGLAAIALIGVAAVGTALVTQHVYGMQPCPWCVLQRIIFLAISLAALLGLLLPRAARPLALGLVVVLSLAGAAAALWQHFVAASAASCDMSLAERIVSALTLDERWPEVFMATASCAEAKVNLAGLPYEFWSLILFSLLEMLALALLIAGFRQRGRFSAARR